MASFFCNLLSRHSLKTKAHYDLLWVYMLLAQEYHCTAQQQYTLAAHLNLASEFLKHMYCRGIRYDAVSNGFNSSMSFEGKNNPVGSPLKIDVALWSCQSNHVRCDRVSARVSTHPKVRKCEPGLMQRLGSRVISARSHGHPLVQTTTFSEKFRYVETQICWIDIGLTHTQLGHNYWRCIGPVTQIFSSFPSEYCWNFFTNSCTAVTWGEM